MYQGSEEDLLELEALRPPGLSDSEWGLFLCHLGLMQIFSASTVERTGTSLQYTLDGKLRAVVESHPNDPNLPHGPFSIFYKDGSTLWMQGRYDHGERVEHEWQVFTPEGRKLEPQPPQDWMH